MFTNYAMQRFIVILFACLMLLSCASTNNKNDSKTDKKEQKSLKDDLLNVGSAEEALLKGSIALKEEKIDLAQAYYVTAYDLEPQNIHVLTEMAKLYKTINNDELLRLSLELILEQEPDNVDVSEQYGLLLIKLNDYEKAEQVLLQLSTNESGNKKWQVFNGLGILADLNNQHQQAIMYYQQAEELSRDNPEILNNIGFSYSMDNQLDKALSYFNRALKINPKYKKALNNYALVMARQGKYDDAVQAFSRVGGLAEAYNNTGYIAMMNGDKDDAGILFHKALQVSPVFYKRAHENLQMLEKQ